MMNFIAKFLVIVHTVLSVAALTWAISLFLQGTDFGKMEPYKEVQDYDKEGNPKSGSIVRHASTIDKSIAALTEAVRTRDRTFVYVKPALDSLRETEPYLPNNHLYYLAELKQLRSSPDPIKPKRFQEGGLKLEDKGGPLARPALEEKEVPNVTKSHVKYMEDLKALYAQIEVVEKDIQAIAIKTKAITADLTGTDETNAPVKPGLYYLVDHEYKAQQQIKTEIDDIKPNSSRAAEQAMLYRERRVSLEASLRKLKGPLPK